LQVKWISNRRVLVKKRGSTQMCVQFRNEYFFR
jgi:hypothetical protein